MSFIQTKREEVQTTIWIDKGEPLALTWTDSKEVLQSLQCQMMGKAARYCPAFEKLSEAKCAEQTNNFELKFSGILLNIWELKLASYSPACFANFK